MVLAITPLQLPTEATVLVADLETGHTKTICHGVADTPRYSRLASPTSTTRSLLQRKHCRPLLGRPSLLGAPPPRVLGTPPPRVLSLGKAPPLNDEDDADDDDYADDDVISWRNPPGILCRPRFCVVLFMVRYVIPDRLVVVLLFSGVCRDLGVVLALTL